MSTGRFKNSPLYFTIFLSILVGVLFISSTKPKKKMHTYLALGDSYTIGELVPYKDNFPHITQRLLLKNGLSITEPVIVATTGWTTDELQAAIMERNISGTYDIVTLLIGVNNQYRGRSIENYSTEYEQLLKQAIHFAGNRPDHVFVLSIPDWGVTPFAADRDAAKIAVEIDAFNAAKKTITDKYNCHYIDITPSTRRNGKNPDYLASDGLHPSEKEYAIWSDLLAKEIIKSNIIK